MHQPGSSLFFNIFCLCPFLALQKQPMSFTILCSKQMVIDCSFGKGGRNRCLLRRWNISQIKSRGFGGVKHLVKFPFKGCGHISEIQCSPGMCESVEAYSPALIWGKKEGWNFSAFFAHWHERSCLLRCFDSTSVIKCWERQVLLFFKKEYDAFDNLCFIVILVRVL